MSLCLGEAAVAASPSRLVLPTGSEDVRVGLPEEAVPSALPSSEPLLRPIELCLPCDGNDVDLEVLRILIRI